MHKLVTIIVAAGSGSRMNAEIPKQFLLIDNEPLLMHTVRNFSNVVNTFYSPKCEQLQFVDNIVNKTVIVLPSTHIGLWAQLCEKYGFDQPHTVVAGGVNRFESVKTGLHHATDADLVVVHDGVRPFASAELICKAIATAAEKGSAVPAIVPTDSLRRVTHSGSNAVDRNEYRSMQTPQVFNAEWILDAYGRGYDQKFTDDASVVESAGYHITLIEGEPENIKITTPDDLQLAKFISGRRL